MAGRVLALAAPVIVEQLLMYLVGLSDTIITGRFLGSIELAAVTTGAYLGWFLGGLLMVVSAGATALVARHVGAGDLRLANRITGQAITLALGVGTLIGIVSLSFAPQAMVWMNLRGEVAAEAASYIRWVMASMPLWACQVVGIACLRGSGDTWTGMWVMAVVNTINVTASWLLAVGVGPFPRMGLAGVAAGTACSQVVGGLLILRVLARSRGAHAIQVRLPDLTPVGHDHARMLRISLPATAESLTNAFCQLWFLGMINRLGMLESAAHGVAIRCESLAFLILLAFSVAGGTLAGQYLGAERPALAMRAARIAWAQGCVAALVLGVALYALALPMFQAFVGQQAEEVTALGLPVLRLVAFAMPALATIQVLSGVLRTTGDTRWPWGIVLVGYLVVRLPLTAWFTAPVGSGGLGLGLLGAWIAMFADLHVRAALLIGRFLQGGWSRIRI